MDANVRTSQAARTQTAAGYAGKNAWTLNRFLIVLGYVAFLISVVVFTNLKMDQLLNPELLVLFTPMTLFTVVLLFVNRPWLHLVTAILIALPSLVVLFLFMEVIGLFSPLRGTEFLGAILHVAAIVLALPAGISGFVLGRKNQPQNLLRTGWRSHQGVYALGISLFFLGALATGVLTNRALQTGATGGAYDLAPEAQVSVVTKNLAFDPKTFTVTTGKITEIGVENQDGAFHTFTYTVGDTTYNHDLAGGATVKFLVKFDAAGTVAFRCKPHSSGYDDAEGMTGTMTVTDAA